ncbi:hypothetical protein Tco_0802836 [Tanacetum coccineum]|uniref:Uncharacterized protein n=1 Tax=Tanacetum coccineum TaxID=301880 RepID=A0ABQ5A435_9ASTR
MNLKVLCLFVEIPLELSHNRKGNYSGSGRGSKETQKWGRKKERSRGQRKKKGEAMERIRRRDDRKGDEGMIEDSNSEFCLSKHSNALGLLGV